MDPFIARGTKLAELASKCKRALALLHPMRMTTRNAPFRVKSFGGRAKGEMREKADIAPRIGGTETNFGQIREDPDEVDFAQLGIPLERGIVGTRIIFNQFQKYLFKKFCKIKN